MRGDDRNTGAMFSYISPEARVRADHPLRPIRLMTDAALQRLSPRFDRMYSAIGRPSIPPEQLLRALLLQLLYTIRSERLLMEELDYSVLFRWFVGLGMDDPAENRHGLIVDALVTPATGTAERDAALAMLGDLPDGGRITVSGDKAYDTRAFVRHTREMGITPQVAQYAATPHRRSAIDGRTTRHAGYALSQQKRKLVEQAFGWMKTIGLLRKLRHRGGPRVNWIFKFAAAAYNLVRLRTLLPQRA